jgi:membrane-associated protease RseP (regulator of RpoE activity)
LPLDVSPQEFSAAPYRVASDNGIAIPLEIRRPRRRYWLHALLFVLTLFSTSIVGASMQMDFDQNVPFEIEHNFEAFARVWYEPSLMLAGLPFSLTLLVILLAHEFGHFIACAFYRIDASLPYFLPSPTLTGTFGAFIRIRSAILSKRQLFDVGVAGPVAGFIFLLPALGVGLALSKIIPDIAHRGSVQFGTPPLLWLLQKAVFPGVASADIYLHPIGRAAWVGILATALNLLPVGQLDGGHILYSVVGHKHRFISRAFLLVLGPVGAFFWPGWPLWALILFFLGSRHPVIFDERSLDRGRMRLGWVSLAIFILCFTLTPVAANSGS